MNDEKTFYIVREHVCNVDLPHGRFDVGSYYVERKYINGFKEIAKFFSNWCQNSIEEYVFEDEKEANQKALEYTLKKLNDAYDGKD